MYLMDADLKSVLARLARKFNASVADREMHSPRKGDDDGSIPSRSSTFESPKEA